ncbi:MAG: hypothetical protein ACOX6O_01210 [Christensenellales bacterium]|jgi:hypothetical protein
MTPIDFDGQFSRWLRGFLEENQDRFEDIGQLETMMPQLYERFVQTPADWLSGLAPERYFDGQSADSLVTMIESYLAAEVQVPELLLDAIVDEGARARDALVALIADVAAAHEARLMAVNLLREMELPQPTDLYISWQLDRALDDELADCALEGLEAAGEAVLPALMEALPQAGEAGQEALLSILSRYPEEPGVYEALIRLFDVVPGRTAVLAAYLGRLGDERALPLLTARAVSPELSYLDYIELRSAIEALGGEVPEREFDDDPAYRALGGME